VADLLPLSAGTEFAAAAVSMDAVAVTWHALVGRGQLTRDERVVVVGAGGLGLNAVQIALGREPEVAVVEPDAGRRAVAERLGVKCAVAPDEQAELAGWADLSFEVSGTRAGFDAAVSTLGEGGHGVRPGLAGDGGPEVSVLGSRGSTRSDAAAALAAVERGEIRPVIDSVWELARAAEAVARLRSGQASGPGRDRCLSAVCACACCRARRGGKW
jgi:D-arabinose 1-dehydrogenase-like Zn-dependent alcohol dehydrogenase